VFTDEGQQAIRDWAYVMNDRTGQLTPMTGIFPDYLTLSFVSSARAASTDAEGARRKTRDRAADRDGAAASCGRRGW
jgi:hypothetical protein